MALLNHSDELIAPKTATETVTAGNSGLYLAKG